jgi:3-dehydroquinate synthase
MSSDFGFNVAYRFPVVFTSAMCDPGNNTLRDAITREAPSARHRLLVVVDDGVAGAHPTWASDLQAYVGAHSDALELVCPPVIVPGGERAKHGLDEVIRIVGLVNDYAIDRQSYLVAVGGGAVLDMVSFAAAIAHRGIRVVRIPTTTLAQGDSGFAVKNGVNFFGKKNFVGTFAPPFAVINDALLLETLSARDRRSGLAEAVKVSLLKDPEFFEWLETNAEALDRGVPSLVSEAVHRSAALHLAHICGSGDPFEQSSARPLDFGHWSAHKLEALSGHEVRHGEAVAIGMALDVEYAVRLDVLPRVDGDRILSVLRQLGFTLYHPALVTQTVNGGLALIAGLQEFREHLGGRLHITLLRGIGDPFEVHEIDTPAMMAALQTLTPQ